MGKKVTFVSSSDEESSDERLNLVQSASKVNKRAPKSKTQKTQKQLQKQKKNKLNKKIKSSKAQSNLGEDTALDGSRKWEDGKVNQKKFKKGAFSPHEVEKLKHALCLYARDHGLNEAGKHIFIFEVILTYFRTPSTGIRKK